MANVQPFSPRWWAMLPFGMMLASCAGAPGPVPVAAPVVVVPVAAVPKPGAAAAVDWRDAPLAPGAWALQIAGRVSAASYGGAITMACRDGVVEIALPGPASSPAPQFTIITSSRRADRSGLADDALRLRIPAGDGLLDAIAFSRGRFAVEAEGRGRLILPADPVISRVVEDCRAGR